MTRQPIIALLAAFVVSACSTEPAREQAAGSAAPASGAASAPADTSAVAAPGVTGALPEVPAAGPDGAVAAGGAMERSTASQPGGARRDETAASRPESPPAAGTAGRTEGPPAGTGADEGADVLRRASAAYENVRSLRADFVMNFENPLLRQATTSRGTIYQQQPDRIALRFSDPQGDVILSDGRHFWVYYPSVNAQQVIRSPASAGGESGVNLQAQFVGNPVERFRYELHGTEQVAGRTAHALTLVPRQRAEYRSLRVWIDARDGLARRFEVTEHNGSVRRFDLQNMQVNPTIPESVFRFTPPEGARIVDAG
jgi:outer membrane lipoprotein carrier protein